jgi:hypothetical protein
MAKVQGPLLSISARGQVGDALQFRVDRGTTHVWRPPGRKRQNRGTPSAAHVAHRAYYAEALTDWRRMGADRRAYYDAQAVAAPHSLSGWNLFVKYSLDRKGEPRQAHTIMNLGQVTDINITPDGRAFEADLIGDGILTLTPTQDDLKISILYLTTGTNGLELAIDGNVEWMDGAPMALSPIVGKTLEVYIRATPQWIGISARFYW